MFAKIKDNKVVTFPYGYDDLQNENPHTQYSGDIDLMEIFPNTEEALLRGFKLVKVYVDDKPETFVLEKANLSDTPTLKNGVWSLNWVVSFDSNVRG